MFGVQVCFHVLTCSKFSKSPKSHICSAKYHMRNEEPMRTLSPKPGAVKPHANMDVKAGPSKHHDVLDVCPLRTSTAVTQKRTEQTRRKAKKHWKAWTDPRGPGARTPRAQRASRWHVVFKNQGPNINLKKQERGSPISGNRHVVERLR